MSWTTVKSVPIGLNWQYTDPIEGDLFRLTQQGSASSAAFLIAQVQVDNGKISEIFGVQEISVLALPQSFELRTPGYFNNRCIAFKQVPLPASFESEVRRIFNPAVLRVFQGNSYPTQLSNWQIQVEVNDMSLNNPIIIGSSSSSSSDTVNHSTVAPVTSLGVDQGTAGSFGTLIAAANSHRKGLMLWNNAQGNLYIEFGGNPGVLAGGSGGIPSPYAFKIEPGGFYEMDTPYTGSINGTWDKAEGVGVFVHEFV